MPSDIVPVGELFDSLRERFGPIEIPAYKFREWYSRERGVFFDCEEGDTEACLERVMREEGYSFFTVFLVVREERDGGLKVMDVSFANIGRETLQRFMRRYESQLKPASVMSLQVAGKEFVEFLGASYEE